MSETSNYGTVWNLDYIIILLGCKSWQQGEIWQQILLLILPCFSSSSPSAPQLKVGADARVDSKHGFSLFLAKFPDFVEQTVAVRLALSLMTRSQRISVLLLSTNHSFKSIKTDQMANWLLEYDDAKF